MSDGTIQTTPIFSQNYIADSRTVQGMAKLTWSLNPDNRLTLAAYGTPTFSGGGAKFDGQNVTGGKYSIDPLTGNPESGGAGTYSSSAHQFRSAPIDASLKWNSQFLDKKLLLDVLVGTHYQRIRCARPTGPRPATPAAWPRSTTSTGGATTRCP
jgi:hypothetical protein